MLIIAAKLLVDADQRDAYVADHEEFVRRSRERPGCLDFVIAADPAEQDRVNLLEIWESDEHLDAHRAAAEPPDADANIRDEDVSRYDISAVRPP